MVEIFGIIQEFRSEFWLKMQLLRIATLLWNPLGTFIRIVRILVINFCGNYIHNMILKFYKDFDQNYAVISHHLEWLK